MLHISQLAVFFCKKTKTKICWWTSKEHFHLPWALKVLKRFLNGVASAHAALLALLFSAGPMWKDARGVVPTGDGCLSWSLCWQLGPARLLMLGRFVSSAEMRVRPCSVSVPLWPSDISSIDCKPTVSVWGNIREDWWDISCAIPSSGWESANGLFIWWHVV